MGKKKWPNMIRIKDRNTLINLLALKVRFDYKTIEDVINCLYNYYKNNTCRKIKNKSSK